MAFDAIGNQFSNIRGMFSKDPTTSTSGLPTSTPTSGNRTASTLVGAALGGPVGAGLGWLFGKSGNKANPMVGDLAVEPVEGDSLTQYLRSLTNLGGVQAQKTREQGEGVLDLGMGITGEGLNLYSQPVDYYQKLLSGDQQAMTEAVAPTARAMTAGNKAAVRTAATGTARSGYRSSTMANQPFEQAGKVSDLYQTLQPTAAKELSGIAGNVSNIGLEQQGVGTKLMGLSDQELSMVLQALMQRRGQNNGVDTANTQMLTQGLSGLLSLLV